MNDPSLPSMNERLSLKQTTGWFPVGDSFRKALIILSDGAFRLFAYLCFEADRRSGRYQATHKELATALGKSKRVIGTYVAELESKAVCNVHPGKNQFAATIFEVSESYWPYHRLNSCPESPEQEAYIALVREYFLALGCGSGKFGAAEASDARDLQRRGIPLAVIEQAMLMGACRKYNSWFQGRVGEPIGSLRYFEQLIVEIQGEPLPPGYSAYLRKKMKSLGALWSETMKSGAQAPKEEDQPSPKETIQ